jgi:hypothetical protein
MPYKIESYDNLHDILSGLGCNVPESITILPENLTESKSTEDFIYTDSKSDLKKLIRQSEYQYQELYEGKQKYRLQRNADWVCPAIYLGTAVLTNENVVSFIINLISSYAYDKLKGEHPSKTIKCEIIVSSRPSPYFSQGV